VVEVGSRRLIVLFDLDLTLLSIPDDRGIRARAIDRATGVPGVLDLIDDQGRTDRWLVDEVAARGIAEAPGLWERYEAEYHAELRRSLAGTPPSALPGADALLEALRAERATLGVSTGNLRLNAIAKLEHARLDGHFAPVRGGFGDHHADRADIVRSGAHACGHAAGDRLVVIGDTVHDVRAALDAGAVPVAVATGHASADELHEAGARVVLPDLAHTATALRAILSG
jgi:phosphoglycolate phosphatase